MSEHSNHTFIKTDFHSDLKLLYIQLQSCDRHLLPSAQVVVVIVFIVKQLPLLPQLVLGSGSRQVARGQQGRLPVQSLVRPVSGRLLSVRSPLGRRGNVSLLLHRLLFPQQRAREVGGVLEPWAPLLLQYQRGQNGRDNFIPSAYQNLGNRTQPVEATRV